MLVSVFMTQRERGAPRAQVGTGAHARALRALVLAAAVALPCSMVVPALALGAATGSITGKVTNTGGGAVVGLEVCAYPPFTGPGPGSPESEEPGPFPQGNCTETHAGGEYAIQGLGPGQYVVEFDGVKCPPGTSPGEFSSACTQNYITQYYNGKALPSEADAITVAEGKASEGINAVMAEPGRIAGRVTSAATGAPIQGAMVCAFSSTPGGFGCAETAAGGEYVVTGLVAGEYKVQFEDGTCTPEGCNANYVTQYFDEKRTPTSADSVAVALGRTTEGINARLLQGGRISGKVTSAANGAPIAGVLACALEVSGGQPTGGGNCARTRSNGEYTVSGLGSGEYKVEFRDFTCSASGEQFTCTELYETQWYNGKPSLAAADPVSVTEPATTGGVNARLVAAPPGTPIDATGLPGSVTREQTPLAVGEAVARARAAVRRHHALLRLHCVGHTPCIGTVKLLAHVTRKLTLRRHGTRVVLRREREIVVGRARFVIAGGKTATIHVRLTHRGRALLRKAGRRGLRLTLAGQGVRSRSVLLG
jgi:hypothetical protein